MPVVKNGVSVLVFVSEPVCEFETVRVGDAVRLGDVEVVARGGDGEGDVGVEFTPKAYTDLEAT